MNNQPLVAIIIINWKQCGLTFQCLRSVWCLEYPKDKLQVIVVDNASRDGSVETIRKAFPDVNIIENNLNLGYTGGNNVGIEYALDNGIDYVLILNNDTTVNPNMLNLLLEPMLDDQQVGAVGPMVYHADEPTMIQSAGGRMDGRWRVWHEGKNEIDRGQYAKPRQVDWLSGCTLMVRAETIRAIGMLDERFFSYWEDVDWCLRMKRAGWKVVHVPEAKMWHKGVQPDYQPHPYVTYYMTRNLLLLMRKHGAPPGVVFGKVIGMLRTITSWSIMPRWRTKRAHRDAIVRGLGDALRQRWGRANPEI